MRRLIAILLIILSAPLMAQTRLVSLSECLDASARNDLSLENSRLDVLSARAARTEALWGYLPNISISAMGYDAVDPMLRITSGEVLGNSDAANVLNEQIRSFAYENGMKPYYEAANYGYAGGISAVQPVYLGGTVRTGNKLAELAVEASEVRDRIARRDSRDSVECRYWLIVSLQEKEKTLADAGRLLDSVEKDVSSAIAAGVATQSDLLSVQLRRKKLESGRIMLRNASKLLKMDLFNTIGIEYEYDKVGDMVLGDALDNLPSPEEVIAGADAAGELDESKLLALNVRGAQLEKKLAMGKYKPQVILGASYNYNDLMGQNRPKFNGMAYATVRVPISDLGKAGIQARRMDYRIQKALNDKQSLDRKLELKQDKCRLDLETAWAQYGVAKESVAVAEDALMHVASNFRAGLATSSELLQAEYMLRSEKEGLISRMIDYRNAVNAYRSLTER